MLLSFEVRNFRCFADEAFLDLTSPSFMTNIPRNGLEWTDATERVAAVYGPNASGKTTVLEAMWSLSLALRSSGVSTFW